MKLITENMSAEDVSKIDFLSGAIGFYWNHVIMNMPICVYILV